ncbi:LysR substrate-binding domain-containing protein [Alistipes putredinis]|uniref:LysR family transcriptional regulator n=1 Tax=Alistipes putredinis TaxID=28117 RepID=UPI003AF77F61
MDDFRLRVFITAAKTLNFTKCAEQLYISQPAVSKHIGELESRYKVQLFERSGSRLALTEAGRVMLEHAERIADGYRRLQYEMDLFTDRLGGELKVGASTTIAQYVLPQVLARFTARFPEVKVSLVSGNSEQVEAALARHDTDLGLVESSARHPGFHYEPFIPDELVLIASTKGRYGRCDQVTLAELQTVPLVLRESGSGTLEVISKYLAAADVRLASLRVVMQLGSTESIKSFVRNSDAMAIVSVASIVDELRSGELRIIDIEGCTIRREFSFCAAMPWPHVSWSSPAIRPDPSRRFCDILQAVFGCGIAAGSVRVLENAVACHRKPLVVYPWSVSVMLLRPKFLTRRGFGTLHLRGGMLKYVITFYLWKPI